MQQFKVGQTVKDKEFNHNSKVIEITNTYVIVKEFFTVKYTFKEANTYLTIK